MLLKNKKEWKIRKKKRKILRNSISRRLKIS